MFLERHGERGNGTGMKMLGKRRGKGRWGLKILLG